MSKISISIDNENGECEITLNGNKVENVTGVYISKYKDYEGKEKTTCEIATFEKDEYGVRKYMNMIACESPKGKELMKAGEVVDKFPGFVVVKAGSKLQEDISNAFTR